MILGADCTKEQTLNFLFPDAASWLVLQGSTFLRCEIRISNGPERQSFWPNTDSLTHQQLREGENQGSGVRKNRSRSLCLPSGSGVGYPRLDVM